jgi:hypothetical protein
MDILGMEKIAIFKTTTTKQQQQQQQQNKIFVSRRKGSSCGYVVCPLLICEKIFYQFNTTTNTVEHGTTFI